MVLDRQRNACTSAPHVRVNILYFVLTIYERRGIQQGLLHNYGFVTATILDYIVYNVSCYYL